ncbi:MAG TPA: hypothetical protein VGR91_02095 [Stellaceae bacterium]|nr:hypothetical protein [Stellaceae bacterium]
MLLRPFPRRRRATLLLRRLDRLAARMNPYLIAAAVLLGLLNLTCVTAQLISPPPPVEASSR